MPKITSAQRAASAAAATHGFVVENVVVAAKESPDAARTWLAKELSTLKVPLVGKDEGLEAALARWAAAAGATPAYDVVAARARLVSGAPAEPKAGAGAVEGAAARLSTLAALAEAAEAKNVRGRNDVERARTGFHAFAEEATPGAIRRVLGAGAPASDAAAWSQFKKVTTDALVARGAGTPGALAALLAQVEAAKTPPGAKDGSSRPPPADAAAEMELHEDALYEVCSDFGAGNAADIQAALMAAIVADLGLPPGVGDSAVASAYAARARAAAGAGASSSAAAHATTEDTAFASAVAYIAKISELIRPKRRRLLLGDPSPPSAPSARPAAAASAPSAAASHGGRAAWNPAIIVDDGECEGGGGGGGGAARSSSHVSRLAPAPIDDAGTLGKLLYAVSGTTTTAAATTRYHAASKLVPPLVIAPANASSFNDQLDDTAAAVFEAFDYQVLDISAGVAKELSMPPSTSFVQVMHSSAAATMASAAANDIARRLVDAAPVLTGVGLTLTRVLAALTFVGVGEAGFIPPSEEVIATAPIDQPAAYSFIGDVVRKVNALCDEIGAGAGDPPRCGVQRALTQPLLTRLLEVASTHAVSSASTAIQRPLFTRTAALNAGRSFQLTFITLMRLAAQGIYVMMPSATLAQLMRSAAGGACVAFGARTQARATLHLTAPLGAAAQAASAAPAKQPAKPKPENKRGREGGLFGGGDTPAQAGGGRGSRGKKAARSLPPGVATADGDKAATPAAGDKPPAPPGACWNCGEVGHNQAACPKPPTKSRRYPRRQ
jgi:hypothetical protein